MTNLLDEYEQSRAKHLTYEELAPYDDKQSLLQLWRHITTLIVEVEENDWKLNFSLINELRRLHKYNKELFFSIFNNYKLHVKILPNFIDSLRSNISKASLTLISEIFKSYDDEHVSLWIKYLLPEVLNKSTQIKGFIKEEASKCLHNLSENMLFEETILALLDGVNILNLKICEKATETLIKLIFNFDSYHMEMGLDWKIIFKKIIEIYQIKNDRFISKILIAFEGKIGKENFENILNENLKGNNLNTINRMRNNGKYSSKALKSNPSRSLSMKQKILDYQSNKENIKINNGNYLGNVY